MEWYIPEYLPYSLDMDLDWEYILKVLGTLLNALVLVHTTCSLFIKLPNKYA